MKQPKFHCDNSTSTLRSKNVLAKKSNFLRARQKVSQLFIVVFCCAHVSHSTALQLTVEEQGATATISSLPSVASFSPATTTTSANIIGHTQAAAAACPCDCSIVSDEDCPLVRYAPRGDCSCCKVCARQKSQTCDGLFLPCDRQFGLTCNQTTNTCEGKYDLRQATPPTHNALTLRWEPFLDANAEPQSFYYILYVEATQFTDDLRKWNSTTSWSQRPVAQVSSGLQIATTYFFLTTIVLNETKEIDYARRTEVIPLRTLGCRHNGQPYRVGEYFLEGCTYNCTCTVDGRWACYERKCPHFYKLGDIRDPRCTHAQDPTQPEDPCCVIYTCPNGYDSREDKCIYDGVSHELGAKFYTANCSERCYCDRLAIAQCEPFTSPSSMCDAPPVPDNRTCFAWQIATEPDKTRGICCPTYKCVNEGVCVVDGIPYGIGDKVPSGTCDEQCECGEGGRIQCKSHCVEPDVPILSSNCPKMVLVNDTQTCCNKWMCSIGADYCVKDNQMYALGTIWNDETCPIRKCHCQRASSITINGNIDDASSSIAQTVCETQCPHIAPSMLTTMRECLHPRVVEPEADTCACPFVTCDPLYDEMTVNDLSYRVASPTAAEISFSLPDSLLAFLASSAAGSTFPHQHQPPQAKNTTQTAPPFFATNSGNARHDPVAAAEPIKSLHLVVAESHPNNGSVRHMHRLDLPYDSLLKERTSFTETSIAATTTTMHDHQQRPKTTVVVRYVLQNLDPTMLYSVKARLILRDGVALPFSNTINITTGASGSNIPAQIFSFASSSAPAAAATPATAPPLLVRTPLSPISTMMMMTARPYYSTAAIKLVQQRKTSSPAAVAVTSLPTTSTTNNNNCHVPVRGVIETFNDGDAVMRNCTHLCRCLRGAVECRYMCWTREHAMQMLRCINVVPATTAQDNHAEQQQPQLECCVQWRCQEEIVVIDDGELPAPAPPTVVTTTTITTTPPPPSSCHSSDGQFEYHVGQTWRNHCSAMCMCTVSATIECDAYNPFCADVEPLLATNYQQCWRVVEHLTSCCPAYSCSDQVAATAASPPSANILHTAISPGLLITLHLLRVDMRPGSHDTNRSSINGGDWWHTTARVRWNVAQELVRQGAVVELVWRPLTELQQQQNTAAGSGSMTSTDNEITAPSLSDSHNSLTVVEAHGEAEVLLDKQKMRRAIPPTSSLVSNDESHTSIVTRRNAHFAYELVLKATLPASSSSSESNPSVNSNYIVFSLPLVLDDPSSMLPSSIVARGTATRSEASDDQLSVVQLEQTTTDRPAATSAANTAAMKDFLFNTTGNGFPLGLLILIMICVGILLCMLCVGCIRCVLVRRRRGVGGGATGGSSNSNLGSKTSSTVSHLFQHGTVAAYAPTTAMTATQISKYDTTTVNLGRNTVSHRPTAAAVQTSANHPQFYLKHSPLESSCEDNILYGGVNNNATTIASVGSTVGSRLAALNHDRHRNGFTVVASAAALPVPLVAAPITTNSNSGSGANAANATKKKAKQKMDNKTTTKKKQLQPSPHTAGVYSIAPQTTTTNTASMSSAMTTPNTSIPDLRSSLVYNKYASFDNLVFTGK